MSLSKYRALDAATRNELTVLLQKLVARFEDRRVVYTSRSSRDEFEIGYRHALAARAYGDFLIAAASSDGWGHSNVRDHTIADTVCWLLEREGPGGRIVLNMQNGHVQKTMWTPAPNGMMYAGGFLHERLGSDYRMIGTAFNGGIIWGTPFHPGDDGTLEELCARAGMPLWLLDFNKIPAEGPVADALASITKFRYDFSIYEGDWRRAFDALVYVESVSMARILG